MYEKIKSINLEVHVKIGSELQQVVENVKNKCVSKLWK